MSQQYQVLARKYRPKNFHELVGQSHVSKALINAIDHNRLHHAYLFTGTRGVGKTTIARILSKCLNCETGVTSTPCGVCSSCVAIDQGRFIDLIEIDAASRTKVEDTRELIDNVPYAPTQGRYKVYLIDEVHMLSTHSFNALLKTLEEPPAHVKFLLATTDPQKLPITIISRCLQFVLRPLPQQALSDHIANLLTQENIDFTQPALWQLANAAKGSVRDALSLTDQAIAFGQGRLTDETVNDMLGLIDSADLISLLLDIYQGNAPALSAHIEQMRAQLVDAGSMFDGLADLLHQIAMVQLLPNVSLNVNDLQAQQITALAAQIGPDVLQLYYQIVIQGREQIKLANTPLQALEMCLLRLLAFRPLALNEVAVASSNTPAHKASSDQPASIEMQAPHTNVDQAEDYLTEQALSATSTESMADTNIEPQSPNVNDADINNTANIDVKTHQDDYQLSSTSGADINPTSLNETDFATPLASEPTAQDTRPQLEEQAVDIKEDSDFDGDYQNNSNYLSTNTSLERKSDLELRLSKSALDSEPLISVDQEDQVKTKDSSSVTSLSSAQPTENSHPEAEHAAPVDSVISNTVEHQDPQITLSAEDPRSLLKCPEQTLEGEWTPDKWDYWLQTARESGALAQDQLAMARQGVMTGEISGRSEFKVAFDTKNMQSIFQHLANHLTQQFGAQVSIAIDTSLSSEQAELLPQSRQKNREIQAKNYAQELITNSPVMQRLIHDAQGKITSLKLFEVEKNPQKNC